MLYLHLFAVDAEVCHTLKLVNGKEESVAKWLLSELQRGCSACFRSAVRATSCCRAWGTSTCSCVAATVSSTSPAQVACEPSGQNDGREFWVKQSAPLDPTTRYLAVQLSVEVAVDAGCCYRAITVTKRGLSAKARPAAGGTQGPFDPGPSGDSHGTTQLEAQLEAQRETVRKAEQGVYVSEFRLQELKARRDEASKKVKQAEVAKHRLVTVCS